MCIGLPVSLSSLATNHRGDHSFYMTCQSSIGRGLHFNLGLFSFLSRRTLFLLQGSLCSRSCVEVTIFEGTLVCPQAAVSWGHAGLNILECGSYWGTPTWTWLSPIVKVPIPYMSLLPSGGGVVFQMTSFWSAFCVQG